MRPGKQQAHVFLFFLFFWRYSLFGVFCTITTTVFSFYGEREYVALFPTPDGFFYIVTTGWISDLSLYENSINQSIMIPYRRYFQHALFIPKVGVGKRGPLCSSVLSLQLDIVLKTTAT